MTAYDYFSIVEGALATILLSAASLLLGIPMGLGLALLRTERFPVLNRLVKGYVSLVRACPVVTLTLLVYYSLPQIGISLDPVPAALISLTVATSAFNCEIWRAALVNFPRDQFDAARAFSMPAGLRFRRIVFPQIWRSALPGLVNEMTRAALRIGARTYDPLPPFVFALLLYGVIVMFLVRAQRHIERRTRVAGSAR
jgi:His/Glu/Gln/Arg/opine family amino acid ABC transporter permease subunit